MNGLVRVSASLARRELLRFFRQPQRVIGTVAQPLLFWLFLGFGFAGSFRPPGMENVTYLEYFYPGVMMMLMLFSAVFSTITIIEDRDAGFLQGVLVAPVSRLAIVLGKVVGATAIAMIQTLIFLCAAPLIGLTPGPVGVVMILLAFILSGIGFASLGFLLAWSMKSTSAFHAVMMVFLMPMWMLSGALFPLDNVPAAMKVLMMVNPVSHALLVVRAPFYTEPAILLAQSDYLLSLTVTVLWAVVGLGLSMVRVNRAERGVTIPA
jgi:ABC-2 type transport system permease protein